MNKELRFSWAHIVALLAAMFFGYMAFIGNAYRSGGNLGMSVVCAVVMALVAIGAAAVPQMLMASDWHMNTIIWFERVFIFGLTPVLCIILLGITGGFNYLNIISNKDDIEDKFEQAKISASNMFAEYDEYSRERVADLSGCNNPYVIQNQTSTAANVLPSTIQKENMELLLKDKITFGNRELAGFRQEVDEYLGGTNTSINNVSVLSDIQALQSNMQEWYAFLGRTAETDFSFERAHTAFESAEPANATGNLQSLQVIINDSGIHLKSAGILAVFLALVGIGCLYLPWIAQPRNSRSVLRLSPFVKESDQLKKGDYQLDEDYPSFIINEK